MYQRALLLVAAASLLFVVVCGQEDVAAEAAVVPSGQCMCSLDAVEGGVCGHDGNTYANDCLAKCAGVAVAAPGPCAIHATSKLFPTQPIGAMSTPVRIPLSAEIVNRYASEGFRLVGRAEARTIIKPNTPPPTPTEAPIDPTGFKLNRYAALRFDLETGLLYSSNGSTITELMATGGGVTATTGARPVRRPRRAGPHGAPVVTEAGSVASMATTDPAAVPGEAAAAGAAVQAAGPPDVAPVSIIGTYPRSQVTTSTYPYYSVVALQNNTWCSGAMINTHAVLTAGHCVYRRDSGYINAADLIVAPGAYRPCRIFNCATRFPCGTVAARTITTYAYYMSTFNPGWDIAVIRLNTDVGGCTGWFGMQSSLGTWSGSVSTAGFPGDKPKYEMWSNAQPNMVDTTQDLFLGHIMDTYGGQSGSPIWDTNLRICAVHAYGVGDGWTVNRGVAIYPGDLNSILQWGA